MKRVVFGLFICFASLCADELSEDDLLVYEDCVKECFILHEEEPAEGFLTKQTGCRPLFMQRIDNSCLPPPEKKEEEVIEEPLCCKRDPCCPKRWYIEIEPGYYLFTNSEMRQFFNNGGFTIRAETGYNFWGPLIVWIDGGYFQKEGRTIGPTSLKLELKLATLTLGLKAIHYFNSYVAIYGGVGPRLFLLMLDNNSTFVRTEDNEIGIGGGFDAGCWIFPAPEKAPNVFLDVFTDFSWKNMSINPDEVSSSDNDLNISGFTFGLGVGFRF